MDFLWLHPQKGVQIQLYLYVLDSCIICLCVSIDITLSDASLGLHHLR